MPQRTECVKLTKTLGLIYTVLFTVDAVNKTVSEVMPKVEKFNIIDDNILKLIFAAGKLTPTVHRIVANYVQTAEDEGADAVLVTCSSISPCVDTVRPLVSIPVMKIDDPMTDLAVQKASKIGVVATAKSTLEPTKMLLLRKAEAKGKKITIKTELCQGAYDALFAHDTAKHDKLVLEGIRRTAQDTDVIVLAQPSMARIVPQIGVQVKIPVLTSIKSGVEQAKAALGL